MSRVDHYSGPKVAHDGIETHNVIQYVEPIQLASGQIDNLKLEFDEFLADRELMDAVAHEFLFRRGIPSKYDIDTIVPVPRGGQLWAEALARAWNDLRYGSEGGVRAVQTEKLAGGTFMLAESISPDAKVALADDVLTTGFSTSKTAALLPAGVRPVVCIYLADRSVEPYNLAEDISYEAVLKFSLAEDQT